jgi:hypothetical protein
MISLSNVSNLEILGLYIYKLKKSCRLRNDSETLFKDIKLV